jgi:hypothetical protein
VTTAPAEALAKDEPINFIVRVIRRLLKNLFEVTTKAFSSFNM